MRKRSKNIDSEMFMRTCCVYILFFELIAVYACLANVVLLFMLGNRCS